jgi:hypothetical protein
METTEKFARLCEVKKTGMNTGFVFYDGLFECEDESDALAYAIGEGYTDLSAAYDDEIYYYTEWEECDDTWYEEHDGQWYECTEDSKIVINNN